MLVEREKELAKLGQCHAKDRFQLVVLYGRGRVGKTTLAFDLGLIQPRDPPSDRLLLTVPSLLPGSFAVGGLTTKRVSDQR